MRRHGVWKGDALRAALVSGLALLNLACGETEPKRGSLMLSVSTDMYINKDLGRVDIIVQPENGPTQSTEVNLFPELDGKFLPGTFAIIEGDTPGEFVRIRVIARKGNSVRVVREAATRIPRERSAVLPMPIQWLCDGKVKEDGQLHRSDCDEDYTCVGGVCKSALVDETSLADYTPERVFGGGNATGGGDCFDTFACFPNTTLAELDLETCQVDAPTNGPPNIAVVLPPGSDGHCGDSSQGCLIPLDESELGGWSRTGSDRLQLPEGVCESVQAGTARGVIVSGACDSKQPNTPTCGPWTLVGTEPGEDPDPIDVGGPGDPSGDPEPALTTVGQALERISGEVAKACAALSGMSVPDPATPDAVVDLCRGAKESLLAHLPVQWHYMPPRCWVSADAQIACERECDPTCDPGTLETRCETHAIVGQCPGVCESRLCLGSDTLAIECQGYCAGECDGQCEGNCFGECQQGCSQTMPSGTCDGYCAERCTGLCEGRCSGMCTGHCDGDPNLPPTSCAGDCAGQCDTDLERAKCEGPLGFSPCNLEPICQFGCRAQGFAQMQCERASTWIMPQDGLPETVRATLEEHVAGLIPVYEITLPALQQVVGDLSLSLEFQPDAYADDLLESQELADALGSLWTGIEDLLLSLGDSRGGNLLSGPGPGPGPDPGGVIDCTPIAATGANPIIDDFEDGNEWLPVQDGRDGYWYFFNDGTGQQYPTPGLLPEPGDTADNLVLHTWGSGFSSWGAGVGLDFRQGGAPHDASRYSGLRFRARGDTSLWVILRQSDLMSNGHPCGTCDPNTMSCDWFHKVEVFLGPDWTQFDLPWRVFENEFGLQQPVNTAALTSIEFEVPAGPMFDVWLDDIEFY